MTIPPRDPAATRPQEAERLREIHELLDASDRAHANALLEDMGVGDCPVCMANRRRQAWQP